MNFFIYSFVIHCLLFALKIGGESLSPSRFVPVFLSIALRFLVRLFNNHAIMRVTHYLLDRSLDLKFLFFVLGKGCAHIRGMVKERIHIKHL